MLDMEKHIHAWEPCFFIFLGLFHMHRIWALLDRSSYASFWMGIMDDKGWPYFLIMGILAGLCVLGIVTFIRERKANYLWRWIYFFGGGYVLFDLFAIATGLSFWQKLLNFMFDTSSSYWNYIWSFFILLGTVVFILGVRLLLDRRGKKAEERTL